MFSFYKCETQTKHAVCSVKGFTIGPSLGDSLPESSLFVGGIDELLEVKDEHDHKAFFIFYWNDSHKAGSTGPYWHKR